jgi:hypothetical protein
LNIDILGILLGIYLEIQEKNAIFAAWIIIRRTDGQNPNRI